jgi:hypothetical protein
MQGNLINIEQSNMKDRSVYFSNTLDFQGANMRRHNFKNYYRPYIDTIIKNQNNITKISQLQELGNKMNKFL